MQEPTMNTYTPSIFRGQPMPMSFVHEGFRVPRDEVMETFVQYAGVRRDHEVEEMLRPHTNQTLSVLARWIVQRRIVSFERAAQRWIPLFQFDLASMTVRADVAAVIAELANVLDDEELAEWFAQPSALLRGQAPIQVAGSGDLLDAARAERFLIAG
jgi:hypothetical protein